MFDNEEERLSQLKARIDAVHERVITALRSLDEQAMDQAMEQQSALIQEYEALLKKTHKDSRVK